MKKIRINDFYLSEESKVLIAAEIGLNHNGDFNLACRLIDSAKASGADAVKFQVYDTDVFINRKYAPGSYDLLKKYQLSFDAFRALKRYCDKKKVIFFATPFDFESADFLFKLKVPVIKIASGEVSNLLFIKHIAWFSIPIFLSTGLHEFKEVKKAVEMIEKINKKLVIMHCVSDYPLKNENAGLNVIKLYRESFDYLTGFSDHSRGWLLDAAAAVLGAKVIEKHFTLDRKLPGPDHQMSLDPAEFSEMAENIRQVEASLGEKKKKLTETEKKIRIHALKSIYAGRDIKKGEILAMDNMVIQRPLRGLMPDNVFSLIGQKARKDYKKFEIIKKNID